MAVALYTTPLLFQTATLLSEYTIRYMDHIIISTLVNLSQLMAKLVKCSFYSMMSIPGLRDASYVFSNVLEGVILLTSSADTMI